MPVTSWRLTNHLLSSTSRQVVTALRKRIALVALAALLLVVPMTYLQLRFHVSSKPQSEAWLFWIYGSGLLVGSLWAFQPVLSTRHHMYPVWVVVFFALTSLIAAVLGETLWLALGGPK